MRQIYKFIFLVITMMSGVALACEKHNIKTLTESFGNRAYDGSPVPVTFYFNSKTEKLLTTQRNKLLVVIINNGYGVKNTEYSFIANKLVNDGYLVVSIEHLIMEGEEGKFTSQTGNVYEHRKTIYERGVNNILQVLNDLKHKNHKLNLDKIILIGHSNGGDIAMFFANLHWELVSKIISLDSRRVPLPVGHKIPILTLRSIDMEADPGVLPNAGAKIVTIKDAKHNDMRDNAPEGVKNEINAEIDKFLKNKG